MLRYASSRALPLVFFLLTIATTLHIGSLHAIYFQDLANVQSSFSVWQRVVFGLPFSLTIMTIIASHELGHYLTARRYQVNTSLPVFIPFPFSIIGTLGAFILIRSPFPNRRSLIDIGHADIGDRELEPDEIVHAVVFPLERLLDYQQIHRRVIR